MLQKSRPNIFRTAAISTLVVMASTLVAAPALAEEVPADMAAREALLAEAHGFGENTTGGLEASATYVVTTEEDGDFPGTLRFAAKSDDAMWITFAPDVHEIVLDSTLFLGSNTTIDGRGADVTLTSPDVQDECFLDLNGDGDGKDANEVDKRRVCGIGGVEIVDESNIIITNIALDFFGAPDFQACCDNKHNALRILNTNTAAENFPDDDNRHKRKLDKDAPVFTDTEHTERNRTQNIWLHKNSFSRAGDKLVNIQGGANGITVSNNRFHNQGQAFQIGNKTTQTWDVNGTVTVDNNFFDNVGYRTPVSSGARVHVYNNYIEGWTYWAISSSRFAKVFAQNNLITANENTEQHNKALISQAGNNKGTTGYGYLKHEGNKFEGGAAANDRPENEQPHLVDFDESTYYTVTINEAFTVAEDGGAFRDNIIANAGVQGAAPQDPPADDPPADDPPANDQTELVVTTLAADGAGSLAEALTVAGTTMITFSPQLDGRIELDKPLRVSSDTTIVGSATVMLRGAGLDIRNASNVILDGLDLRNGTGIGVRIAGSGSHNIEIRNSNVSGFDRGLVHVLNAATDVRIVDSSLQNSAGAAITAGFVKTASDAPITVTVDSSILRRTDTTVDYLLGSNVEVMIDGVTV